MSAREGTLLAGAKLFELSPEHVDEGERIGFLHEDKAAALGRLMAVDGQRDPIKVVANKKNPDKPWRLVTGMHRLIGARLEGITVWAIEVTGKREELADLEASENLHRRPLAPIERAKFVQALCQAAQERIAREHGTLSQHQLGAKARWERVKAGETRAEQALQDEGDDAEAKMAQAYGWQESVADALDLGRSTIKRALRLYHLVIEPFPELVEALSKHPVVGENESQLRAICDIRDEQLRRQVIDALLSDPEIGTDDARILAGINPPAGPAPLPYQKHFNAIEGGWSRLGTAERRRFLQDKFVSLLTPDMKLDLRDRLNKELGDGEGATLKPAVSLRTSVKVDYIVCLEDGTRHINLSAYIKKLGMTPADYRARWNLPSDYPMLAPNYRWTREQEWRRRIAARRAAKDTADAR